MKRALFLCALVSVLAAPAWAEETILGRLEKEIRALAGRAGPSVVRVSVELEVALPRALLTAGAPPRKEGAAPKSLKTTKVGTGFVLEESRVVVTTQRIVGSATVVRVDFPGGATRQGKVLGSDRTFNVAVLEIEPVEDVVPLALDSEGPTAGSLGVVLGNSFGVGRSISLTIVSEVERRMESEGEYDGFMVLNSPVHPGDDGGPILGAGGKVIGMSSGTHRGAFRFVSSDSAGGVRFHGLPGSEGRGLAIPARDLEFAVAEIKAHGRIRQGHLGIIVRRSDLTVLAVEKNSPADRAGIAKEDVVLEVAGRPARSIDDLSHCLLRTPADCRIAFLLGRGEKRIPVTCELCERAPLDIRGISVSWVVPPVVSRVRPELASLGVEPGDILLAVNGVRVNSMAGLSELVTRISGKAEIRLELQRGTRMIRATLSPPSR